MRHEVKGTNTLNGVKKWICPELSTTVISKLPRCGPSTQRPCHSYTWYGVLSSSCRSGRPMTRVRVLCGNPPAHRGFLRQSVHAESWPDQLYGPLWAQPFGSA